MKKKDVLKFFEQRTSLKKEANKLGRSIEKLKRRHNGLINIVRHLEYLNIIDNIPVYLYETYGGLNVMSSFQESKRSAFLESIADTKKFNVKLLNTEQNFISYHTPLTKKQALVVAAKWIDTGEVA